MLALTMAFAVSVVGSACNRSAQDSRDDAAEAQRKADRAATEASQKARDEAQDAQRTANPEGGRLGAAGETLSIKTALIADKTVDASDINVDTYADTKTVVLRGTVPLMEQKTQAEKIAMQEAPSFHIDNQLTVKPRSRQ